MYINYDLAVKYTYSKELLKKIASRFLEEYENLALKLLDFSKEEVLAIVHKIKGITLNLGAEKLYKDCIKLESSDSYDDMLKVFIYTFNKSYAELSNAQFLN
ncbi:MAG: hypothetical protein R3Y60_02220 [bacterium]